jgi:hydroxymethylbilane synthase
MSAASVRLATRRSPLALAQSRQVGEQVAALTGRPLELVAVASHGDQDMTDLATIGGEGVFVAAVRQALVDGRADLAVHSLKDLPTATDDRFVLAAVPRRADPRDVLVSAQPGGLQGLPLGARVGTGSPRRRAQLRVARPDLEVVGIRGNVETRIARVGSEPWELDAVVLAAAGLFRLGLAHRGDPLSIAEMVPAPGQGALAVEVRSDLSGSAEGARLLQALAGLEDAAARCTTTAERAFLAAVEAGCASPVGAVGDVVGDRLTLTAVLQAPDGTLVRGGISGSDDDPAALGRALAQELLGARTAIVQISDIRIPDAQAVETGSARDE